METHPTENLLEMESIPETLSHVESITTELVTFPAETFVTSISVATTAPVPTNPSISTQPIEPTEPIQKETSQVPPETEWIVEYPLNLNTATFEELCTLPEIGETLAQAIIEYRERIGGFINREQLLEVSGIGEHRYSAIVSLLMIENEQPMPVEVELPQPEPEPQIEPELMPEPIPIEPIEPEMIPPTELPEMLYINLNTTTKEQLMALPNCTEEIAKSIIELREKDIHTFSNPFEILYTDKISDELYQTWEEYLFVDDSGSKQLYLYSQEKPE